MFDVKAKNSYFELSETNWGVPPTQESFEHELMYVWDIIFSNFVVDDRNPNGGLTEVKTTPTLSGLQLLYDATAGPSGKPDDVNYFYAGAVGHEIFLQSATDSRWEPYLEKLSAAANDGHPDSIAIYETSMAAHRGEPSYNFIADDFEDAGYFEPGTVDINILPNMPSMTDIEASVVELYVAYFNRAPESSGLSYWVEEYENRLLTHGSEGAVLKSIANDFWPLASEHYSSETGYSSDMSNADFVAKVYNNVLGRADASSTDKDGVNYWINALDSGVIASRGEFIVDIITSAKAYIDGADADDDISNMVESYFNNRLEASSVFVQDEVSAQFDGVDAIEAGFAFMNQVDQTPSSVSEAIASLPNDSLEALGISKYLDDHLF